LQFRDSLYCVNADETERVTNALEHPARQRTDARRFALWFWGNGTHPGSWAPTTTGPGWEPTSLLRGLAPRFGPAVPSLLTPPLFAALYGGKAIGKGAQAHGVGVSTLSDEKVALWDRLKTAGAEDPLGPEAGVARLAYAFARQCVQNGEKVASDRDVQGQCISIGTAVHVDRRITKMAEAGDVTIKEAAHLRIRNAECALYELGLLT